MQADEDAFKKTQEADRLRQAQQRKVQEAVDRTREQNARRKMDKVQNREWDSGKSTNDWNQGKRRTQTDESEATPNSSQPEPVVGRGRGRGRRGQPRGRGRGRGAPSAAGSASQINVTQVADAPSATEIATVTSEESEAVGIAS